MATRSDNHNDSDGANHLPPVDSEPVLRLVEAMIPGTSQKEYVYAAGIYKPYFFRENCCVTIVHAFCPITKNICQPHLRAAVYNLSTGAMAQRYSARFVCRRYWVRICVPPGAHQFLYWLQASLVECRPLRGEFTSGNPPLPLRGALTLVHLVGCMAFMLLCHIRGGETVWWHVLRLAVTSSASTMTD